MLLSIGIVGPPDLVNTALKLSATFPEYRFIDLSYEDENDTVMLFEKNRARMDVCLFTGNWPYFKTRKHYGGRDPGIPMVYVYDTESALHKAIAKMLYDGTNTARISIDTALSSEVDAGFSYIGIRPEALYLLPVDGPLERSEFVSFHRSLWEEGKTTAAVTFFRSAYAELSKSGMPVYRCTPGEGALKEAIVRSVLELQMLKARAAQMVVGLVTAGSTTTPERGPKGQEPRTALLSALLEWARPFGISVVPLDGGVFSLFLTRGVLEEITLGQTCFGAGSQISKRCGRPVFFGFGIAQTASLSYANASLALEYAMETSQSCLFTVFDDSRVVGPLGSQDSPGGPFPLEFTNSTTDPSLVKAAVDTRLSVATVSKVQAVLRGNGSLFVTPDEIAVSLSISKRNARRILARIEGAGLARVAGIKQSGTRGRPQRIYRVDLA